MQEQPELFIPWNLLILLGAAVGALFVIVLIFSLLMRILRRPKSRKPMATPLPDIDLASISQEGPDIYADPRMEFFGIPVKLAMLVVAPSGSTQVAPSEEALAEFLDGMVPGLQEVYYRDRPEVRRWPAQLSASGFVQSFFNKLALPSQGKGTPWSGVAGRFEVDGHPLLLAILCRAAEPNSTGQVIAEHEGQWRDTIRIRRD